jgi:hypothetical protein
VLGELPKLFGKSFAIGFLLPATALGIALFGLLAAFGIEGRILALLKEKDVVGVTLALVALWLLAIALMALNRPIIRLLEGYGSLNPFRLKVNKQRAIFDTLHQNAAASDSQIDLAERAGRAPDPADVQTNMNALLRLASDFPDQRWWLLPTKFGNVLRAFEVYPRVIYGLEGVQGWSRLLAVIPTDYREAIEQAKAQTDFWVNLWLGSTICLLTYFVLAILYKSLPYPWVPIVAIVAAIIAAGWAREMARGWGMLVMSAFDLFRGDLCRKLGFSMPRSVEKEREMWQLVSQVMVYRQRQAADRLTQYRVHEDRLRDGTP